jgi:hypothetical protein
MLMRYILKFITYAIVFLIFASNNSFAQIKSISGTVADSVSKEKLPGVNVIIITKKDNKVYSGIATDVNGKFILKNVNEKDIYIKFSMIGYKPKVIDKIEIKNNIDLGLITLSPSAVMMQGVEVKGQREMIEYKEDKVIVNIDKVPGNSSSVSDALRNSGIVDVDPSSKKISIRGSNGVNIKIDGKPLQNADDLLSQMPASYIDKVEISTVPSAKDDPEGDAGIINIITKKNTSDNYNGSISLYGTTQHIGFGSAILNYKKGKFNFNSSYMGYVGDMKNTSNSSQINYNSRSLHYVNSGNETSGKGHMNGLRAGIDYEIDTLNSISFNMSYNNYDISMANTGTSFNYDENHIDIYDYLQRNNRNSGNNNIDYSLFYKNKINNNGCELTSDLYYMKQDNNSNASLNTLYNYLVSAPALQMNNRNDLNKTLIFKLEYVNPTENYGKFEAGYWYTYRNRLNDYKDINYLYSSESWADSLGLSNIFKYREIIHSSYLTYSKKILFLNIKGGLRLEQTFTEGDQEMTHEVFDTDYFSAFPSLMMSYKISDRFQVSLNAARRISRPRMDQINPFVIVNGPNSISKGNSKIEPTYTNIYELSLSSYLKFYYSDTKGRTNNFSTIENDSISLSTYINSKSSKTYGVDINIPIMSDPSLSIKLPDWLTMINLSFNYYHLNEEAGYNNDNYLINRDVCRINCNSNMKLWYDINATVYVLYSPKYKDSRFTKYSSTYMGIYFNKDFFDKKMQIGIELNDLLHYSHMKNITVTPDFYSYSNSRNLYSPCIGLLIRYNFNDFKIKNERKVDDERDKSEGGIF